MVKYIIGAVALSMLLTLAQLSFRFNSSSVLTTSELEALPIELRNAAVDARNTRIQMQGKTWVFAFAGSSDEVTDGDVTRAKLSLSMSSARDQAPDAIVKNPD